MAKKRKYKSIALMLAALILCVCALSACGKKDDEEDETSSHVSQAISNTVEWNGKTYKYNENLTNILFLGIDKSDIIDDTYAPGDAGQSDCIILLSLNEETGQAVILQINRNTMTDIDVYDYSGNYLKTIEGQLALQYAYDIGGESSCWATKKTVGEILEGVEIDGYFALAVDGVPEINDALGGVDVYMREDYTYIDESFVEGTTVHLEGTLAQRFVQYRDTEVFDSVTDRMARQVDYITALITQMNTTSGTDLYEILSPYMGTYVITDLTADELNAMRKYEYLTDDVLYLPGETVMGEVYEEYYIDEDELEELIMTTFYVEVED